MAEKKCTLTQERLKQVLHYDPDTGLFTWLKIHPGISYGMVAGSESNFGPNGTGYINIQVDGIRYPAHRLAWLYEHGAWPTMFIDHRNGKRNENRISNLRDVSLCTNQHNRWVAQGSSRIGVIGVKKNGPGWSARIKVNGESIHLGTYPTIERAGEEYLKAKAIHHK